MGVATLHVRKRRKLDEGGFSQPSATVGALLQSVLTGLMSVPLPVLTRNQRIDLAALIQSLALDAAFDKKSLKKEITTADFAQADSLIYRLFNHLYEKINHYREEVGLDDGQIIYILARWIIKIIFQAGQYSHEMERLIWSNNFLFNYRHPTFQKTSVAYYHVTTLENFENIQKNGLTVSQYGRGLDSGYLHECEIKPRCIHLTDDRQKKINYLDECRRISQTGQTLTLKIRAEHLSFRHLWMDGSSYFYTENIRPEDISFKSAQGNKYIYMPLKSAAFDVLSTEAMNEFSVYYMCALNIDTDDEDCEEYRCLEPRGRHLFGLFKSKDTSDDDSDHRRSLTPSPSRN